MHSDGYGLINMQGVHSTALERCDPFPSLSAPLSWAKTPTQCRHSRSLFRRRVSLSEGQTVMAILVPGGTPGEKQRGGHCGLQLWARRASTQQCQLGDSSESSAGGTGCCSKLRDTSKIHCYCTCSPLLTGYSVHDLKQHKTNPNQHIHPRSVLVQAEPSMNCRVEVRVETGLSLALLINL